MRRLFILTAIVGLFVIGLAIVGNDGLQGTPVAQATETTTTWMYPASGGITVPGGGPTTTTAVFLTPPCNNCYITRIAPDLVYMNDPDPVNHPNGATANFNNNSLDNVWLHHLVVVDACSMNRIFASGNERTIGVYPAGFGYFQNCANGWHVNYHIHNSSSATRSVALKLVVTYRTGETLLPTTPIWLDMSNTGTSEFTIPEGYSDTQTGSGAPGISSDWTSNVQGQIISIGGHVHDYGISVAAYNNRLLDYICTSTGGYGTGSRYSPTGGPGTPGHPAAGNARTLIQAYHEAGGTPDDKYHIQEASVCSPTYVQSIICVGDVITLHTQYNNTSGFPIFDAMGIIVAQVATNLPDSNSNGTIDACEDSDGDGLKNVQDNCPSWPNPTQALPAWPVPTGDDDCDGYPSSVKVGVHAGESVISTDASLHCNATVTRNDEADVWPPDMDDNQLTNLQDVGTFNSLFGFRNGIDPGYTHRKDLNNDNIINLQDIGQINPFFGKKCVP